MVHEFSRQISIDLVDATGNIYNIRADPSNKGNVQIRYIPKEYPGDYTILMPSLSAGKAKLLADAIKQIAEQV